jgi:hypothetical protein
MVSRKLWMEDQLIVRPLSIENKTNTERKQTYIHASSWIRTHDPSVRTMKISRALEHAAISKLFRTVLGSVHIQSVLGWKVNIQGGHSIGHSKQKSVYVHVSYSNISEIEPFRCTVPKLLIRKRYDVLFLISFFFVQVTELVPITVVSRSKTWTVFDRLNFGIVGSNPIWGMNVCVRLFCVCVVLYAGSGLATGWCTLQGVPTDYV